MNENLRRCCIFLRASLKGWTYAVENPETIGQMVARYNPKADPSLDNAEMVSSLPLINTGGDHNGWMRAVVWVGMQQTLLEQLVLNRPMDFTQVYTL